MENELNGNATWFDELGGECVIERYVLAAEADYSIVGRLVQRIAAAVELLTIYGNDFGFFVR